MDNGILKRNLLALASRNPSLSIKLGPINPAQNIEFSLSKSGHSIPSLSNSGKPFHSRFDPVKEGERMASTCSGRGYIVCLGFGAGYHITPLLKNQMVSGILVIERDLSFFKRIISEIDLHHFIMDPRVSFLVDESPDRISEFLLSQYLPALTGDIETLTLRTRINTDEDYFMEVLHTIKDVIGTVADDYTVQAYFGKKWFLNSIANLQTAEESTTTLSPIRKALVTAAGPSLEMQIPQIKEMRGNAFLIATDTSLPALLQVGVIPDLVISIDCQHISYHHFLSGFPEKIPLVLDLASPTDLTRFTDNLVFFTSGHPFSRYINTYWRKFPLIDISGGNVSHAAVSLADSLGAREIYLFGADFSYPEGKAYSRGTYIYPYFRSKAGRVHPVESLFFSFILRNKSIQKEPFGDVFRYTTKPMISYKERLEHSAVHLHGRVIGVPGMGIPLSLPESGVKVKDHIPSFFSAGPSSSSWCQFLTQFRDNLKNLQIPDCPLAKYLWELSPENRDIWTTLYPAAATQRKKYGTQPVSGKFILEEVKDWTIDVLNRVLER
ncbi:MAG: motility associated factor glycosyltransferase family protein [Spirochaetales bacterium]|nr:motility associated factor glycosyltransferase family protein [Spirochaetales bacterium]